MSLLDRIRALPEPDLSAYLPFRVDGLALGHVEADFAARLARFSDTFRVTASEVALAPGLAGSFARTRAVGQALRALRDEGCSPGWREELYPVGPSLAEPLFALERAAIPKFGVRACGVHLNGYVRTAAGLEMWIGRRADDRLVEPGKLDQLVAGGLPAGLTPTDNLRKEAAEEAAIPSALIAQARACGTISYRTLRPEGLRNDVLFVYDLELPADFEPHNTDGEIAGFARWPISRLIAELERGDAFKFNCSLVAIDFLIRHGLIAAEHPDYAELVRGLHR